jgi:hypothetical protein
MLIVRRYMNLMDAGLAKTLLDDYEVFCALFDENAHCLGLYIAVPVRLVVANAQFARASRILAYAETLSSVNGEVVNQQLLSAFDDETLLEDQEEAVDESLADNNPWEILAITYLFLVPGLGFLLETRQLMLLIWRSRWGKNRFLVLSPFELHLVGVLLIGVAVSLTVLYFYVRRVTTDVDSEK